MTDETEIVITAEIVTKVLKIIDAGLVGELGDPIPGKMCVEAAVCFALGLPHGDNPPCVDDTLREIKINLNDCDWASKLTRAQGLRKLAIAQLGSAKVLDVDEFERRLIQQAIAVIVPHFLYQIVNETRKIVDRIEATKVELEGDEDDLNDRESALATVSDSCHALLTAVHQCESVPSFDSLYQACSAIKTLDCALTSYNCFDTEDFEYIDCGPAITACTAISDSTAETDNATQTVSMVENTNGEDDEVLVKFADMMVQILIDMKAPGCQWLSLCE